MPASEEVMEMLYTFLNQTKEAKNPKAKQKLWNIIARLIREEQKEAKKFQA